MNLSPQKSICVLWITKSVTMHPLSFYNHTCILSHVVTKPSCACVRTRPVTSQVWERKRAVNQKRRLKDWASDWRSREAVSCVCRATLLSRVGGRKRGMSLQHRAGYFCLRSFFSLALGPIPHRQNAKQIVSRQELRACNRFTPAVRLHRRTLL